MDAVGIICEYNPMHNGHIYHINKCKEMFPSSPIVLILNGYFLERGEISILSKEEKTKLALENGIDLVIELPFVFGSQAADIFAYNAIYLLNILKVKYLVFGSESNNLNLLKKIALKQEDASFNEEVKNNLAKGINYPKAVSNSLNTEDNFNKPNDLLGISYLKAINKLKSNIIPKCIKRTSDYHDLDSTDNIISATNIRNKLSNNEDISKYMPKERIETIDYDLLFKILKVKILTDNNLDSYVTVNEGIHNKLKKEIISSNNLEELIKKVKSKRYTYNRIKRMLIHILLSFKKEDNNLLPNYIKVLGYSKLGKDYLNSIKNNLDIPFKPKKGNIIYEYELKALEIYNIITHNKYDFDYKNKPLN